MAVRVRAGVITVATSLALCALAMHRPGTLVSDRDDPTAAIVGAAAWLAWALVGYLLLAVALNALGHLAGSDARTHPGTTRVGTRVTPPSVRRLVDAAVGATAAVVVVTAGPVAAYADAGPRPTITTVSTTPLSTPLDWPGLGPAAPPRAALVTAPARHPAGSSEDIVVRAGDSLWTLTARRLGPGASAAEVAAEWPRLYAANRAVIGTDPGLIHPGQRLALPAYDPRSPR